LVHSSVIFSFSLFTVLDAPSKQQTSNDRKEKSKSARSGDLGDHPISLVLQTMVHN